jgi:hypothetical protein
MKNPRAPCKKHGALGAFMSSAMTAAAGKQNDGNDDQPKGAIVKQIAKTVIHIRSSIKSIGELWVCPAAIIL